MIFTVEYWVNLNLRDKHFGYQPDHLVKLALTIQVEAEDVNGAANRAFALLQRLDGSRPSEKLLDAAAAPSMSVGDVLYIPEAAEWHAVARIGFVSIDTPLMRETSRASISTLIGREVDRLNAEYRSQS